MAQHGQGVSLADSPRINSVPDPETIQVLRGLDSIHLKGISAQGIHGAYQSEKHRPQTFIADLTLWFDSRAAASTDDLQQTIDYGIVAQKIVAAIEGESLSLVEALASRIAMSVLEDGRIAAVQVLLHKPQAPLQVPYQDVAVRILRTRHDYEQLQRAFDYTLTSRPETPRPAVLALGANLGDPVRALRDVVATLQSAPEFTKVEVSPLARTRPVLEPGAAPQPDYYNAVVRVWSCLSAAELLELAHHLEDSQGRKRPYHWAPRTLDVDVVDVLGLVSNDTRLTLPHPRAAQRAFVLVPWSELDSGATLAGQSVAQLAEEAEDAQGIVHLWSDWLDVTPATGISLAAAPVSDTASQPAIVLPVASAEESTSRSGGVSSGTNRGLPSWQAALPGPGQVARVVDNGAEVDIIRQDKTMESTAEETRETQPEPPQWKRVWKPRH